MSNLVCVSDYEQKAHSLIEKSALGYYRSGAGAELSLNLNSICFDRLRIRPQCLRDVSQRSTACTVLGVDMALPLGISPTAMQKLAHPGGEMENAKGAGKAGIPFTLSTIATSSIEEVAAAAPDTNKFFQLYIYTDREITQRLIQRAENCGYKAIVLTVDTPLFGLRRSDMRNKFSLPPEFKLANFTGEKAEGVRSMRGGSGLNEYIDGKFDASVTWEDVKWLIGYTKLPVILKGIMIKEDALKAVELGVSGIIVSNHGARQLDSVPATIEALPEIMRAVGDRCIVMLDGGIRQGTDIFKALALGAKMVFIGRPALYGLAVNGHQGVADVVNILQKELDITMALAGCKSISEITSNLVVHESYYAKL